MSFKNLNKEELHKIAEFFAVDVVAVNEKEPSKQELLAAIQGGDEPVTWDDYKNIYLVAEKPKSDAPELTDLPEPAPVEKKKVEKPVVVKMDRKNPRYDVAGFTFTREHPFQVVDEQAAVYIIRNHEGFRLALESEITDFYS